MAQIKKLFNQERVPLHKVLPLDTPFAVEIEPANFCNSKCKFCYYSHESDASIKGIGMGGASQLMSDETFELLLEQIKSFPSKVKKVGMAGMGEPLMHPKLPIFIKRLKNEAGVERVVINTNGLKLNKKLSMDLIEAGLDRLQISVNGLSSQMYKENCNVDIDFDDFKNQIAFYFENKQSATVTCKMLDCCFGEDESEADFFKAFENICDEMDVERTIPVFERSGVDYDSIK